MSSRGAIRARAAWLAAICAATLAGCYDIDILTAGAGAPTSDSGNTPIVEGGSLADGNVGGDGGNVGTDGSADDGAALDADIVDAGGADTTTPVDAGPSWKLYTRSVFAPTQWNNVPLDAVWTGANAPPPRNIRATVRLTNGRLLAMTDAMVYMRDGGTWVTPKTLASTMPLLVGRTFKGARHLSAGADGGGPVDLITFSDYPTAIIYSTDGDTFTFFDQRTVADSPGPISAPQGSKKSRWVICLIDPSKRGTSADYLNEYESFVGDPNVYFYDATPAWTNKWLFANAPLFAGTTGTPPETQIESGWHDDSAGVTYLIVR